MRANEPNRMTLSARGSTEPHARGGARPHSSGQRSVLDVQCELIVEPGGLMTDCKSSRASRQVILVARFSALQSSQSCVSLDRPRFGDT